jgi:hypothetical protein
MAMDMTEFTRAAASGGIVAGLAYWMSNGTQPTQELLTVAAIQAVSVLVSDRVHVMAMVWPSNITGALGTGATYAAVRYYLKGETDWTSNAGYSAASDYVARAGSDMLTKNLTGGAAADADSDWGE